MVARSSTDDKYNLRVFHDDHEHDPELWGAIHRLEAILDEHEEMGMSFSEIKAKLSKAAASISSGARAVAKGVGDSLLSDEDKFRKYNGDRLEVKSTQNKSFAEETKERDALMEEFKKQKKISEEKFEPIQTLFKSTLTDLKNNFASDESAHNKEMEEIERKFTTEISGANSVIKAIIKELTPKK